jgi:hypothetical protein
MNLPFDLNRVRSMIDETNLSSNARQFMNDLQHRQDRTRTNESSSSPQFNISQLMCMMKGKTILIRTEFILKISFRNDYVIFEYKVRNRLILLFRTKSMFPLIYMRITRFNV